MLSSIRLDVIQVKHKIFRSCDMIISDGNDVDDGNEEEEEKGCQYSEKRHLLPY